MNIRASESHASKQDLIQRYPPMLKRTATEIAHAIA